MKRCCTHGKKLLFIVICLLASHIAKPQSPSNLTANAPWDEDAVTSGLQATYSGSTAIQNAFSNARRAEESQLGLTANALGNLTLPIGWAGYTNNEKAYTLLNAERSARAGITYTSGVARGLPFEASDAMLGTVAQNHANYLKASNLFTHTGAGGTTPFDRIKAVYPQIPGGTACSEFLGRSENIAIFGSSGSSGNPLIIERAIYNWIYDDASSLWGHREACLLQDKDLATANSLAGFKNNYGSSASEGFINIATAGATDGSYPFFGAGLPSVDVVVMLIMDPVPSATATTNGCTYSLSSPALPVELSAFQATLTPANQVRLNWETASERNSSHFIVERSRDLLTVEAITTVEGNGTVMGRTTYRAYDKTPLLGVSYYRLKQVDRSGVSVAYRWVLVRYVPDDFAVVSPNPTSGDYMAVQLAAGDPATTTLTDLLGRPVMFSSQQTDYNTLTVKPTMTLSSGLYLLSIRQNGVQVVKRVLVR